MAEKLAEIAHRHLGQEDARRWLSLLRPRVHLVPAEPGDRVIGRFAGTPSLPADFAWPVWPGRGPLLAAVEVDLAALAGTGLDCGILLPREGRLIAFVLDDPMVYGAPNVWEPESLVGARLLHVPQAVDDRPWSPPDAPVFPGIELTGIQKMSFSERMSDLVGLAHEPHDPFRSELNELLDGELGAWDGSRAKLGGWTRPIQGDVEYEVAMSVLGRDHPDIRAEMERWRTLLEVGTMGEMPLSDGIGYWLCRDGDTKPLRADEARFTYQSS